MVVAIIVIIAMLIVCMMISYKLGKDKGAEEAYEHINMAMEVLAEIIQEQQERENLENIFEEFK